MYDCVRPLCYSPIANGMISGSDVAALPNLSRVTADIACVIGVLMGQRRCCKIERDIQDTTQPNQLSQSMQHKTAQRASAILTFSKTKICNHRLDELPPPATQRLWLDSPATGFCYDGSNSAAHLPHPQSQQPKHLQHMTTSVTKPTSWRY